VIAAALMLPLLDSSVAALAPPPQAASRPD
jgi:hypothetical protein